MKIALLAILLAGMLLLGCTSPSAQDNAPATAGQNTGADGSQGQSGGTNVDAGAGNGGTASIPSDISADSGLDASIKELGDTEVPTLTVQTHATLGKILADSAGLTLYTFTKDTAGKSTCYDACATKWPALLTGGEIIAGTGVDKSKVGAVARNDGTIQVTYGGMPLYYYYTDTKVGDANGQGIGSVWYVVEAQ